MAEKREEILIFDFSLLDKYGEHPPKELVEAKIKEAAIQGEEISYEDAEKRVSFTSVIEFVAKEMSQEFDGKIS